MQGPAADNSARRGIESGSPQLRSVAALSALPLRMSAVASLAAAMMVASGADLAGEELQRLPRVRLPLVSSVAPSPGSAGDVVESDEIVQLAGGAVELRVRQGWWIWEVPQGREVRVALSPTRPASLREPPVAGYWACFHLTTASPADPGAYLADQMQQRLSEVTGGQARPLQAIQFQRLGRWDAAVLEFALPAPSGTNTGPLLGRHVLAMTPWGLFEFHAQFPASRYQGQTGETERLLQHVQLSAPAVAAAGAGATIAETIAAAPIQGSWKAFRSRLRLSGNGDIEIVTDRAQLISPPDADPSPVKPEFLRGRYRAEGDLLFVQWQDGSRLNFRWKLNGGDLLLTDHDGQISQLRRIAE